MDLDLIRKLVNEVLNEPIEIKFKTLHADAQVPQMAHIDEDVGFDVFSTDYIKVQPLEIKVVSTGIACEIPQGYYIDVNPRSGLAIKNGIHVLAGIIDSGYRNEIKVVLVNLLGHNFVHDLIKQVGVVNYMYQHDDPKGTLIIKPGDKIAQFIVKRQIRARFIKAEELSNSARNLGGFGSTGK